MSGCSLWLKIESTTACATTQVGIYATDVTIQRVNPLHPSLQCAWRSFPRSRLLSCLKGITNLADQHLNLRAQEGQEEKSSEVLTRRSGRQSRAASPLSFQEDTHHKDGSSSNKGAVACASTAIYEHKRYAACLSGSTCYVLSARAAKGVSSRIGQVACASSPL